MHTEDLLIKPVCQKINDRSSLSVIVGWIDNTSFFRKIEMCHLTLGTHFFQGVNLDSVSRLLINPICETAEKNLTILQVDDCCECPWKSLKLCSTEWTRVEQNLNWWSSFGSHLTLKWTASELVLSFDTGCDAEFSSAVSLGSLVRQIWWIKNSHKEGPKAIITGPKAK